MTVLKGNDRNVLVEVEESFVVGSDTNYLRKRRLLSKGHRAPECLLGQ
jgi:hypothetical protein